MAPTYMKEKHISSQKDIQHETNSGSAGCGGKCSKKGEKYRGDGAFLHQSNMKGDLILIVYPS